MLPTEVVSWSTCSSSARVSTLYGTTSVIVAGPSLCQLVTDLLPLLARCLLFRKRDTFQAILLFTIHYIFISNVQLVCAKLVRHSSHAVSSSAFSFCQLLRNQSIVFIIECFSCGEVSYILLVLVLLKKYHAH